MSLSKAFDCIPHDLLITKLHAYGLSFDTVTFLKSYLKDRKQNVTINNIFSAFQNILSGVPQGSILGLILFNIFLNDLFLCINKSDLHNFADDNTITATCNTLAGLLKTLEQESESAVGWFKQNEMILNEGKFQAIILNKKESEAKYKLTIDKNDIESTKSVKLVGTLVWHFSTCELIRKIEKIQKCCLRIVLDDYGVLLRKSGKVIMEIKRLRVLSIEIFKTVNNLNPNYMKDIFTPKLHPKIKCILIFLLMF